MALTKISTDGVKDDAVTAGKIPANAVGSSELADNAVDEAAIATGAVTVDKIGSSQVTEAKIATGAVTVDKIGNNQVNMNKLSDLDNGRIIARVSGGAGNPEAATAAQIRTLLNVADGATNSTSTTINNNANNRLITGSGTANTLEGEAGLTYNGQALNVNSITSEGNAFRIFNTTDNSTRFHINGEGDYFTGNSYPRSDANMDLGFRSGYRWRDLILSGGVQLGGTGTSNLLDDYEEGTFTPALTRGYSSISYHFQNGFYTKIGNVVHFTIYIYVYQATGDADYIQISLPFTSVNDTRRETGAYPTYDNGTFSSSTDSKSTCCFLIGRNVNYIIPIHRTTGSLVYGNQTRLGTGANNQYFHLSGMMFV